MKRGRKEEGDVRKRGHAISKRTPTQGTEKRSSRRGGTKGKATKSPWVVEWTDVYGRGRGEVAHSNTQLGTAIRTSHF